MDAYGFDVGIATMTGGKLRLIKLPVKYIGDDKRCHVNPGPPIKALGHYINRQPQFFFPGQWSFDMAEAQELMNKKQAELDAEATLSDDEWAKRDTEQYLARYFEPDVVERYLDVIGQMNDGDWWRTYIKILNGKVYFTLKADYHPSPFANRSVHKAETKSEREARNKRQIEENKRRFEKEYRVVEI